MHVCTLPVTQIVSVIVAIVYVQQHPELSLAEAWAHALAILAAFQITPISPGSLVRGLYVLYLVIRERNFRDYNIAVFLGFFKYVGYLAFPIQMAYHYPALARFMAGHWATGAVHVVPVFGEKGALLDVYPPGRWTGEPLGRVEGVESEMTSAVCRIVDGKEILSAQDPFQTPVYPARLVFMPFGDHSLKVSAVTLPEGTGRSIWWAT